MQLIPLSTDGRVTVVMTAPLPPGPLRVALRVDGEHVVIETLGPAGARPIGRFAAADAAAYRPALARLATGGRLGTCPARVVHTGEARTLVLHLGPPARCGPREGAVPPAVARTARLRPAVATACAARPQRPSVPSTPAAVPAAPGLPRRSSLPARPPARFGQPDDPAPRLTGPQRRRVLWATAVIAAGLLLACVLQPGPAADQTVACPDDGASCRSAQTAR